MPIKISDYEKILDLGITPNQQFLLELIDSKNKDLFARYVAIDREDKLKNDLYILWTKNFIEGFDEINYLISFDNLKIVKSTVKSKVALISEDPFYMECYNTFPAEVKTGGYPVRSDKKAFVAKLQKFEKEYPEFTRDTIKKAFEYYVSESRKNGYNFMSTAGYFISKQDSSKVANSILSSYCQLVLEKGSNGTTDKFSRNF